MANPRKAKGNAFENVTANLISDVFGIGADRCTQYDQNQKAAPDVLAPGGHVVVPGNVLYRPPLCFECKDQKRLPGAGVQSAYDQAVRARDELGYGVPLAVFHPFGTNKKDPSKLLVVSNLQDLFYFVTFGMVADKHHRKDYSK